MASNIAQTIASRQPKWAQQEIPTPGQRRWAAAYRKGQEDARAEMRKDIQFATAQLRHAYTHLINGTFEPKSLADGLVAPEIRRLEKLTITAPDLD